jgi:hypothetical protein
MAIDLHQRVRNGNGNGHMPLPLSKRAFHRSLPFRLGGVENLLDGHDQRLNEIFTRLGALEARSENTDLAASVDIVEGMLDLFRLVLGKRPVTASAGHRTSSLTKTTVPPLPGRRIFALGVSMTVVLLPNVAEVTVLEEPELNFEDLVNRQRDLLIRYVGLGWEVKRRCYDRPFDIDLEIDELRRETDEILN